MALAAAAVAVNTTAGGTLLNSAPDADGVFGSSVLIRNPSTSGGTIYIGPTGVTSSSGLPLAAGEQIAMDCKPGDAIYGITASGTVTVNVLATSV